MNEDLAVPASLVVGRQDDYFLMFPFPLHLLWVRLAGPTGEHKEGKYIAYVKCVQQRGNSN